MKQTALLPTDIEGADKNIRNFRESPQHYNDRE